MGLAVFCLPHHENQEKTKRVESSLVPRLDEGSNPSSSTMVTKKALEKVPFLCLSYFVISEFVLVEFVAVIDVATVDYNFVFHNFAEDCKVGETELAPFGY